MSRPTAVIQAEFDRIARADTNTGWNHNNHYHDFLLRHLPARGEEALDVGCGTGEFARLLAQRSQHVTGLDLSPVMIELARQHAADFPNITYQVADVMAYNFPPNHFDCVASIATLHHLPLEIILAKMAAALRPGGVLLILDLFHSQGLADLMRDAVAVPVNKIYELVKNGIVGHSPEAQAAWAEHGAGDVYPTMSQVREIGAAVLPGARITRHVFWRYSIIWTKS